MANVNNDHDVIEFSKEIGLMRIELVDLQKELVKKINALKADLEAKKAEEAKALKKEEAKKAEVEPEKSEQVTDVIDEKSEQLAEEVTEDKAEKQIEQEEQAPVVDKKKTTTIYFAPNQQRPGQRQFDQRKKPQTQDQFDQRKKSFDSRPSLDIANAPQMPQTQFKPKDSRKKDDSLISREEKKTLNKKSLIKRGYIMDNFDYFSDSDDSIVKNKKKKPKTQDRPKTVIEHATVNSEIISIKTLAEKIGQPAIDIVKKLFDIGQVKTINETLDFDTAELIALDYNVTLTLKLDKTAEDKVQELLNFKSDEKNLKKRPPVVTIMGHVDHGKTSLLDYIRKAHVASGEAGGITQHIGAYTIKLKNEKITFLDTPGHEAFTTMRRRGAMVTDIAIIVVAADDGIMPQTIEAISHAKEAGVSIIVAANKMDKMGADIERIKKQLSQHDLLPEDWGGETIVVGISAKTGEGIDSLLESILLVAEMLELKADKTIAANGSIVEAKIDKGTGPIATVIVSNGTLKIGNIIVAGTSTGRVRALINDQGKQVKFAEPGDSISILGFSQLPNAGDVFLVVDDEKIANQIASERIENEKLEVLKKSSKRTLEDLFKNYNEGEMKALPVIIKGDVQGSVEAVKQSLEKLSENMKNENVKINIIHSAAGAVNESDISLADTSSAIVIAFNVRPDSIARNLAERLGIDIRTYKVIYDVIDEVEKALKGLLDPTFTENVLGQAKVREVFNISGVGTIAGSYVIEGKIVRNKLARLLRDNVIIFDGTVSSLKRLKDDAKEVLKGYECGIGLKDFNDIKIDDVIEIYEMLENNK